MKKLFFFLFFLLILQNSYAENKIAYIDINHLLNNSIVGNSILNHINKMKENKNSELALIQKKLSEQESDLIKKKNIIETNEFEKQVNKLRRDIDAYNNNKKKINIEIENKKIKYTKTVLNTLNLIISKYVEDNAITMVFPKKNIVIAKKNLDITEPVMILLNNQLKNIEF